MAMLSIPSYKNDDPNYRYKMPRLVAKVEGRGNGIKTNIVNMGDIARALKRPPDYPTKFCGTELGAQSKFDPTEGKAIVNGAHEQRDLQLLIDKFIEKFVLCENCKLPEIDLTVRKSRLQYRCNACGSKGDSDNTHKLSAFILKNPPINSGSTMGSKSSKHIRRDEKYIGGKNKLGVPNENTTEDKKKKKDKHKEEKVKVTRNYKLDKSKDEISTDSLDSVNLDQCKNIDKSLYKNNSSQINALDQLGYSSSEVKNIIQQLFCFISDKENNFSSNENITPEEFCEQLRLLQISQGLDDVLKFYVALMSIFAAESGGMTSVTLKNRIRFLKPVAKTIKASNVLIALQDFFYFNNQNSIISEGFKAYAAVLYTFYDNELLSGEDITQFFNSTTVKKFKNSRYDKSLEALNFASSAAQPFLNWLNASSDED